MLKVPMRDLLGWRVFRFAVVGGIGALLQFASLAVLWTFLPYQIAFFLAIEAAVVSNFVLNNLWTFSDRKIRSRQIPSKLFTFNVASAGSVAIQQSVALVGEYAVGLLPIGALPWLDVSVSTGHAYVVVGVLLGMFWNYFAYSRCVWKEDVRGPRSR